MARAPRIDGWFRKLGGDRLEVFLKVEGGAGIQPRKIRASGPAAEMDELGAWFEEKTGLTVSAPWRTVKDRPIPGQTVLDITELSSHDATLQPHG